MNVVCNEETKKIVARSSEILINLAFQIKKHFKVDYKFLSLQFGDIVLNEDSKRLNDYDLVDGSTVVVVKGYQSNEELETYRKFNFKNIFILILL